MNARRMVTVLEQGLATPEHAAFARALAEAAGRQRKKPRGRHRKA